MENKPDSASLLNVYARLPVTVSHGAGCRIFDDAGRNYLDFGSGVAVNSLGHGHPRMMAALLEQAARIWHCSNRFRIPKQARCADLLTGATFADRIFFCNSGAEANEAGIKTMRRRQASCGHAERWRTIVFSGAFHGRTLATLAATDRDDYRRGFGLTTDGFDRVALNDLEAVARAIGSETAGILLELIQGDGGVRVADGGFVRELRSLASERDLVLMFDEIQTGVGRTGTFLACEQFGVEPDLVSLAKGLGGGFPIGALLATEAAAAGMDAGSHGTTFGGNPLACAVASAVVEEVLLPGFLEQVQSRGRRLGAGLRVLVQKYPRVLHEARGWGLMQGLKTAGSNVAFEAACVAQGLIVLVAADSMVRLIPPLIVSDDDIDEALRLLDEVCRLIEAGSHP
jgi:acetylornithine/N-succinyldiaminopimelate aminotransferase